MMEWLGLFKKSHPHLSRGRVQADPSSLKGFIEPLVQTPEPRTYKHPLQLKKVANSILDIWRTQGLQIEEQVFKAGSQNYSNAIARYGPSSDSRIVVGAHYDVAGPQPGADDNASGVAGLLELGRLLALHKPKLDHQLELVAYCLEEPPFFGGPEMGSAVQAASLKKADARVKLMISLEMIGYFSDAENSQSYPLKTLEYFYPSTGNFIAVVGALESVRLVRRVKALMQEHSPIPIETLNAPRSIPGVGLSDHSSYWDQGYPAIMITDTAFYRNPHYHSIHDTIQTLDFNKMSEVVSGVYGVITAF